MRDKNSSAVKASRLALMSVFLAGALVLSLLERALPFDFAVPGVKLGLANAAVLASLYVMSPPDAFKVVLMKSAVSALMAGSFFSLLYGMGGSLLSFFVMLALSRPRFGGISPVGVSVAGAVFHNVGQVAVAAAVLQSLSIAAYLPVLIFSGVITGVLTGVAVKYSLRLLSQYIKN